MASNGDFKRLGKQVVITLAALSIVTTDFQIFHQGVISQIIDFLTSVQ